MRLKTLSSALPILIFSALIPRGAIAACPDGIWQEEQGEECDDGNATPGDGCSADCQAECSEVGGAATDHTCQHGAFGPFVAAPAQVYPGFIYTDVSSPHTYFTLTLTGQASVDHHGVIFYPAVSGDFAIYMKTNFPLSLRKSATGEGLPVFLEHAVSTCAVGDSLTWVKTFKNLSDHVEYTLDIGPTADATVSLALEYLPSFGNFWYRDIDHDNYGGQLVGQSWCKGPAEYMSFGEDCDDTNAAVNPDAIEVCNGLDDNCDGAPDVNTMGLCDSAATGNVCVNTGTAVACGCEVSTDCSSGMECSPATRQCQAPSAGGDEGEGGEAGTGAAGDGAGGGGAGGDGSAGDSSGHEPGDEEPEAGSGGEPSAQPGDGGTAGKAHSGGSSAKGGSAGDAGGNGGKASAPPDEDDEGDSGCQLVGTSSRSGGWIWVAVAAAATLVRRRKRVTP